MRGVPDEAVAAAKPTRKERELKFRTELVLDAAEEVFAESSFAQTSVEDIARRAEVSVGTLYNLFHSKEDIYREVVSRSHKLFFDTLIEKIDGVRGPQEKVRAAVAHFFEHFSHYSRHFRLYVSASNGFQWELTSKMVGEAAESQALVFMRMCEVCQQGLDQGIFRSGVPAEMLVTTLLGVPHSFLTYWLERDDVELLSLLPAALETVDRIVGVEGS
ncbi:MAG: TetR/AcrR family transcriptional regulator [Deltaproteobacteria bacterium]